MLFCNSLSLSLCLCLSLGVSLPGSRDSIIEVWRNGSLKHRMSLPEQLKGAGTAFSSILLLPEVGTHTHTHRWSQVTSCTSKSGHKSSLTSPSQVLNFAVTPNPLFQYRFRLRHTNEHTHTNGLKSPTTDNKCCVQTYTLVKLLT